MKNVKLIMAKEEICQLDCIQFKGVESFNIYMYLKEFLKRNGWDDMKQYCTTVDYDKYVCHIYSYSMKEVEE